jgi:hypothetical protein
LKITKRVNFYCDECGTNYRGISSYRFEFEFQKRHVTCVEICEHCLDDTISTIIEHQLCRLEKSGDKVLHGLLREYHENYKKQKSLSL